MNQSERTKSEFFTYFVAIFGIVSPLIWILTVIVMGFIEPDYNHLSDFMSTLGDVNAEYPIPQRINFFQWGLSIMLLAIGLYNAMDHPSILGFLFMEIVGLGVFLSGIFSSDQQSPSSFTNMMHDIVGIPAFLLLIFVPFIFSRKMRKDDQWQDLSIYSSILTPLLFIELILMLAVGESTNLVGLFQRIFLGTWMVWLEMVSIRLYSISE